MEALLVTLKNRHRVGLTTDYCQLTNSLRRQDHLNIRAAVLLATGFGGVLGDRIG
jgi:hypothetical protein